MKILGCTIEARMSSSRLPGKVMMKVNGRSVLDLMISRIRLVPEIGKIVIATTTNESDDVIVAEAVKLGVGFFRGSEVDVLSRVLGAIFENDFEEFVALTGDCPLIDPEIISNTIKQFNKGNSDYISNALVRSYPDGMDTQVLTRKALERSSKLTTDPVEREHVTLHICRNPEIFKVQNLLAPKELFWPKLGLTLDQIEDWDLIRNIFDYFWPRLDFSCREILEYLKKNPTLLSMNASVNRKGDQ
jgi:spore coat polysaccharide biosynthesis protein SpsF